MAEDLPNSDFTREDALRWEEERKRNLLMKPSFFPETSVSAAKPFASQFLPWGYNYATDSWEWAWPEVLKAATLATKGAAEMAGGQRPVDETGVTKFVLDAWMPSGMAGALGRPGLGVFGGTAGRRNLAGGEPRGESWHRMRRAVDMNMEGKTADKIWQETGWFKGADGKWRFEIVDLPAKYYNESTKPRDKDIYIPGWGRSLKVEEITSGVVTRVGDILEHEQLYKAYPEIAKLPVYISSGKDLPEGATALFTDYGILLREDIAKDPKEGKLALLHEIQHAIQSREGFLPGGSPDNIPAWLSQQFPQLSAEEIYHRLAGEVEARNVENRLSAGDWIYEGYGVHPTSTEDISKNWQILWGGGENAAIKGFHGSPYRFEPVEHNPFGEFRDEKIKVPLERVEHDPFKETK